MKLSCRLSLLLIIFSIPLSIFCQNTPAPNDLPKPPSYPKIAVYMCFALPIVSTNSKITTWNFSNSWTIGVASGINIYFSDKFGFSYDMGPFITTTKGISKVSNFVFDPGPVFRLKNGYSITTRMSFETGGRFGESTVFAKVFTPSKSSSLFVALGIPIRFGNNLPASIGASLFFGIGFK